jgi:enolase
MRPCRTCGTGQNKSCGAVDLQGSRSPEEQIAYISDLVDKYGLVYIEDPLYEEDFEGFAELTRQVGDRCLICGDDLFVTRVERIIKGIEIGAANCVLIKPNQVGTLTDTFEAVRVAQSHGMDTVMSHRSGETTDETIAHLAAAFFKTNILFLLSYKFIMASV